MRARADAEASAAQSAPVTVSELAAILTPTATPTDLGTAAATGSESVGYARADHAHRHGQQQGGNQHQEATAATAGFMSAVDKATLDALAAAPPAGEAFPVGAIYLSVTGVDPSIELGYGTWDAFGTGRVLVGFDSGDVDFDAAEETGGAKTVASAGSVAAPTISGSTAAESSHTHTYTEVPNHTHPIAAGQGSHQHGMAEGTTDGSGTFMDRSNAAAATNAVTDLATLPAMVTDNPTGGVASGTTAAGSSHSHGAGTLAASAPSFTGSATSVVQPYIVVHMWKRTA